ncbi:MAG: nucleotidyltransferase domain-containing protein, partial [Candidatus Woesearchaeota archaeon]
MTIDDFLYQRFKLEACNAGGCKSRSIRNYYGHGLYSKYSIHKDQLEEEGFALWMEYYLSEVFNLDYDEEAIESKALLSCFAEYSNCYTDFGLIYSCGLPKYYTNQTLTEIIRKIYGEVNLALIYGSKKPYSDIDLFLITEKKPLFLGWLD